MDAQESKKSKHFIVTPHMLEKIQFLHKMGFTDVEWVPLIGLLGGGWFSLGGGWSVWAALHYEDSSIHIQIDKSVVHSGSLLEVLANKNANIDDVCNYIRKALVRSLEKAK